MTSPPRRPSRLPIHLEPPPHPPAPLDGPNGHFRRRNLAVLAPDAAPDTPQVRARPYGARPSPYPAGPVQNPLDGAQKCVAQIFLVICAHLPGPGQFLSTLSLERLSNFDPPFPPFVAPSPALRSSKTQHGPLDRVPAPYLLPFGDAGPGVLAAPLHTPTLRVRCSPACSLRSGSQRDLRPSTWRVRRLFGSRYALHLWLQPTTTQSALCAGCLYIPAVPGSGAGVFDSSWLRLYTLLNCSAELQSYTCDGSSVSFNQLCMVLRLIERPIMNHAFERNWLPASPRNHNGKLYID
ncbi:hypothetical protein DFH09DRAFT_1096030 [Mycena vulgaris]|nr:hypothetical protein DFH09DRAFT_1096030 [Mycena vulgaris]